jgi:hypothetical protein
MEVNTSALLLVSPQYAHHYSPLPAKVPLPLSMTHVYDSSSVGLGLTELQNQAESLFSRYTVSADQIATIEKLTRLQSKSHYWNDYREGRVTASRVGQVMRCNLLTPNKTAIIQTCYPCSTHFKSAATE